MYMSRPTVRVKNDNPLELAPLLLATYELLNLVILSYHQMQLFYGTCILRVAISSELNFLGSEIRFKYMWTAINSTFHESRTHGILSLIILF